MLPSTHLPVGVSTEDCLAWSSDYELAIAAGEEVYILIPWSKVGEPWLQIRFRVNTFTYDEWPLQRQASFADMSIGEEQAKATIVSLSWSPPGLAKHKRSVLAILTSNLLVSLWAPGGNRTSSECWQRILIVDQTRIRSMTWAPTSPLSVGSQEPLSSRKCGPFLLVVAGENKKIFLLNILSPFNSVTGSWIAEEVGREIILLAPKVKDRPSLLRNAMNSKNFINHVAFGNWDSADNIKLTYRCSGQLYQSMLTVRFNPLQATLEATFSCQSISLNHETSPAEVPSSMQKSMQRHRKKYSTENHLNLNDVILKTWGFATLSNLLAVCVTCHPANMVEYQAASESYSTILFDDSENSEDPNLAFPWQKRSAVDEGEAFRTILLTILDVQHFDSLNITPFDLKIIYAAVCATMFHRMSKQQRLPCLDASVAVLDLLETDTSVRLQAERESIAACKGYEDMDVLSLRRSVEQAYDVPSTREAKFLDICPICEDTHIGLTIVRQSFWEAHCPKKHPFCRPSIF